MDGSSVLFIVMPIVVPLVLFTGIALPFIADSRSAAKHPGGEAARAARQESGPVCTCPRVVIVGAGFAGLNAARALRGVDAEVTIVDGHDYHTFQPLLYQVSTGYLAPEEVGAALRAVFRRQANVRVRVGTAAGLDYPAHALVLQDGSRLRFDYLIVAAGAETNFFGIPGMREHGWPLYTLPDAIRLRRHLLSTLEQAAADPAAGPVKVVVAGGGATGVETAGALTSMARELAGPAVRLQVTLVEATPRLLNGFSARSSRTALADLRRRGVDVRLSQTVQAAGARQVTLSSGEQIQTSTVIWAAGVRANGLGRRLGLEVGDHGRIVVNSRLQAGDHPDVFAAGDVAAVTRPASGQTLPMLAPAAIQSGRHAGEQVARLISGQSLTDFGYRDKGVMAVLGRGDAVAELPVILGAPGRYQLRIGGRLAWLLWLGVHIVYLIGFRNRLQVLIDWAWNCFTSRGAGAILLEQPESATPTAHMTDRTPARVPPSAMSGHGTVETDGNHAKDRPFATDGDRP
ncbi:MAG: NAD(P)/FAD-dependent oxidoreductase [Terracidiphilus sp.]